MANRIKLTVLGATIAPYSSDGVQVPPILTGVVSEPLSFDVTQIQIGRNTSSDNRALFPFALSWFSVKYVLANHFTTSVFYTDVDQDTVNTLANG